MTLGDNNNTILYQGQWIQRSEYDRIMAQQQAAQQAQVDAQRKQQEQQQAAQQQRIAELNPATASFVKAVPGEQGRPTVIQRYHSDSGQYDTIQYDSASPEMKRQADEYIRTHESEFWNIPKEKRTGYVASEQGYIDTSKITDDMRVTIEGSNNSSDLRAAISRLPNWTPVNYTGFSGDRDVFAYQGGLVNSRGEYYTGYGPATSGGVFSPSSTDVEKINEYINGQQVRNQSIKGVESGNPDNINLSDMYSGIDNAPRLTKEQLSALEKGGSITVKTENDGVMKDITITSERIEESKPVGFGENWNAGVTDWEKGIVLPFGAPAWIVGDVLRTPGNMATMVGGVTGEAASLGGTMLAAGPIAAGGKAWGDYWKWETDLAQSLKSDPTRYLYNFGLGLVVGKGIAKGIGIGGKAAGGIFKEAGTAETYGSNVFKGTTRPFQATAKTTASIGEDAGPIADGFAMLDDAVLPGKGITIKNPPPPARLSPAPAGKGLVNQILAGYAREAPESYAPKNYYNNNIRTPKMPGNSMVDKILAGYSREMPESYMGRPNPTTRTIDLTRESQRLWKEDMAKTQKAAYQASEVDMTREVNIGGVKYKGPSIFADEKGTYGGVRQVMANPETLRYAKGTGSMFKSPLFIGGSLSISNMLGTVKPRVPSSNISVMVNTRGSKQTPIITPNISDLIGTSFKTNTKTSIDILSMDGAGTPPTNKQTAGQSGGLAFALGGIAGIGAMSYGRKSMLGSSMGIGPGYGSYKKMLKPGAKRDKYFTGDITGLLYGKKKKSKKRAKR